MKIVDAYEVFPGVGFGFTEDLRIDQIEHHLADITCTVDAPLIEHRHRHRAKALKGQPAKTIQQLSTIHVSLRFRMLAGRAQCCNGEVEGFTQKIVATRCVAAVILHDFFHGIFKAEILHVFVSSLRPNH